MKPLNQNWGQENCEGQEDNIILEGGSKQYEGQVYFSVLASHPVEVLWFSGILQPQYNIVVGASERECLVVLSLHLYNNS